MLTNKQQCIDLIKLNGGKFLEFEYDEEGKVLHEDWDLNGFGISMDVKNDEITFIGENGDFGTISLDYFALLGFLTHYVHLFNPIRRIEIL